MAGGVLPQGAALTVGLNDWKQNDGPGPSMDSTALTLKEAFCAFCLI